MRFSAKILFVIISFAVVADVAKSQEFTPRIINGEPTDAFESVGIVGSTQDGGFCTGTLISASHVLTAAHCADFIGGQTNGTFEIAGQVYFTKRITIHPDFNDLTLRNDVAVMELEQPVDDIEPSRLFRDEPVIGELLTIVGYGGVGGSNGGDLSFGEKKVGTTPIDDVQRTQIYWYFDDPAESNTAAGDSGGPGFVFDNGDYLIASITSGGTSSNGALGDTAVNVRVDAFADWIDAVIFDSIVRNEEEPDSGEEPDEQPTDNPSDERPPVDEQPTDETPDSDEIDDGGASESPNGDETPENEEPSTVESATGCSGFGSWLQSLLQWIASWIDSWLAEITGNHFENASLHYSEDTKPRDTRANSRMNRRNEPRQTSRLGGRR